MPVDGAMVYNKVNLMTLQILAEGMYPVSDNKYGVISTLIYGAQWDTALKFIWAYNIGEVGYDDTYAINSMEMENYKEGDEFASTSEPSTCGVSELFIQKNIYDMAGNVWKWIIEIFFTIFIFYSKTIR